MGKFVIGLDSGTSGIKAILFDLYGNQITKKGYPLKGISKKESWYEEDFNEIWEKAQWCIGALTDQYPAKDIIGIGITAQGDGLWLMDEQMNPVRNGCCFCDGRGFEQFERWTKDSTAHKVFRLTGTRLFTGNQPCILKWMAEHEEENLDRAKYCMHLKDALFYKLTGSVTTDTTDQSLVFLDMVTGEYNQELFKLYGLEQYIEKFLKVKKCSENKASISKEMAEKFGFDKDMIVTGGPMDVAACAIGAGVIEKGSCCSIIGTAALHEMVIDTPCTDEIFAGMTVFHAVDGKWLRLMASLAGTPNLEWLLDLLGEKLSIPASREELNIYDYVEYLISNVPIGSNGVMYHPYLLAGGERAPFTNPNAKASFTGLSVRNTVSDLLRSCFEGVAFAMCDCYDHMPIPVEKITICGGGSSSNTWCQMFADVLGKDVITVEGDELGAKGAAINNCVVQGIFGNFKDAVNKTVKINKEYKADLQRHEEYQLYFKLYKKTYESLMDSWKVRRTIIKE